MKLCTFEVSTHLGRHTRVGAFKDGRIIDLNFATAWYLAQQGESEPQQLADALVPPKMLEFLRAGLRAMQPSPVRRGTDDEVRSGGAIEPELKLAAVIGKQGIHIPALDARQYIAGFTGLNQLGARYSALGPCLVTLDEITRPYDLEVVVRVNGQEFGRTTPSGQRLKFEQTIEALSANDAVLPGDVISCPLDLRPPVRAGDVIELEIEKIGTLRTRVV